MSDTEDQQPQEVAEVEEEVAFISKDMVVEVQASGAEDGEPVQEEEMSAVPAEPADDDRTEDQVPDITGTENVDPMTTSMDGIEELPQNEEAQEDLGDTIYEEDELPDDLPDQLESSEYHDPEEPEEEFEEPETHEEHEEHEEEEEHDEVPAEEPQAEEPAPVEETAEVQQVEETTAEPAAEEPAPEAPVEEEIAKVEEPVEEAAPAADEPVAEEAAPVEEAAPAEEPAPVKDATPAEEPPVEEEKQEEEMAPPAGTPGPEVAEKEFELRAPPEGKRPRTPNELDNPAAEEEFVDAPEEVQPVEAEVPATPKTAASEKQESVPVTPKVDSVPATPKVDSVPATPKVDSVPPTPKQESVPQTPKQESVPPTPKQDSVPPTPKSAVGSVPPTPKTAEAPGTPGVGSVPPTPKSAAANGTVCNGGIPGTPKSAVPESVKAETPMATPSASTPKATGTPKSKTAFTFEETPATPKDTSVTFDDAIATPATPKSAKTPRTPRTPRTPKTPKTPAAEPVAEPEPEPVVEAEPEPEPVVEAEPEAEPEPVAEEPEQVEEVQEEPPVEATEEEPQAEPEAEPAADVEEVIEKVTHAPLTEEVEEERPVRAARVQSPSPPPRRERKRESPSPERRAAREPAARDHVSYDQDSFRQMPPPRLPTATSFSSWNPPDKTSYTPITPFATNPHKYKNEYTNTTNYRPNNMYTSIFDDIVSTGAFSSALYSTTRLIERSRSRTRERRQAMRSQRSASNYYKYTSQYPAPTRTREYSTPPSHAVSRPPSRSGSFISFMEYSGAKNGELSRNASRTSLYDGNLSRSASRGNVDMYLTGGRLSRVDSYVRDLHTPYEYEVPSTYERYRSASRPGAYSSINGYTTGAQLKHYASCFLTARIRLVLFFPNERANDMYLFSKKRLFRRSYTSSPSYIETESTRRMKRYQNDAGSNMVRSMYESRIGHLERSLSREKINKDRMRSEYSQLSNKLDQACRQMDLLSLDTPLITLAEARRPRPSIAYTLALHATGVDVTERWRRGNAVYGGMYSRPWNDDVIRRTIAYYTACAAKRK